jgi:hypothetical protein
LKIAELVNEFKGAVEKENIVKVFLIEKRINNLIFLEKRENFKKFNTELVDFSINNVKYLTSSDKKVLPM